MTETKRSKKTIRNFFLMIIFTIIVLVSLSILIPDNLKVSSIIKKNLLFPRSKIKNDSAMYEVLVETFLGNEQRNYYGEDPPDKMDIIWKLYLGKGKTVISRKIGEKEWEGAGWTGQPLLVRESKSLYLILGAYDHNLKKIDAGTGKVIWQYQFDDVVKGTATIWHNRKSKEKKNRMVILQGSRLGTGNYLDSRHIPSYRAISYFTGEELWRLDVKLTESYSRDADGSALIIDDTAFLGLENSLFTVFDPDYKKAEIKDSMLQPKIYQEIRLYEEEDVVSHNNNVVTESSPCKLDDKIYVASGSGHVYGYDLIKKQIIWDFFIGSDIDGTTVVTHDSCLLVTIEKQYISGKGGAFKLDPSKSPENAVVWYFPTENEEYLDWEGGIIGSAGINDHYNNGEFPYIAAFIAIDGYLYVVNHMQLEKNKKVAGPDNTKSYPTPVLVFKKYIGPSISTPVIVDDKLIAPSYDGINLFTYDEEMNFINIDSLTGSFESTPIVYDEKIYIASRDGYFYCLGNN
ncbi:MAG: PQQ-like beta-propeller repeat protein [Bacteroidales bacterium]|nr:MAG: PQQ-like beta-propeller repeat protein [Bacteroidales bacterium]